MGEINLRGFGVVVCPLAYFLNLAAPTLFYFQRGTYNPLLPHIWHTRGGNIEGPAPSYSAGPCFRAIAPVQRVPTDWLGGS